MGVMAAIQTAGAGLLTENNDGCGVRVTFYPATLAFGPGGAILAGLYFDHSSEAYPSLPNTLSFCN